MLLLLFWQPPDRSEPFKTWVIRDSIEDAAGVRCDGEISCLGILEMGVLEDALTLITTCSDSLCIVFPFNFNLTE